MRRIHKYETHQEWCEIQRCRFEIFFFILNFFHFDFFRKNGCPPFHSVPCLCQKINHLTLFTRFFLLVSQPLWKALYWVCHFVVLSTFSFPHAHTNTSLYISLQLWIIVTVEICVSLESPGSPHCSRGSHLCRIGFKWVCMFSLVAHTFHTFSERATFRK